VRALMAVVKDAFNGWSEHRALRMGASLAYYTVFSLGPMLLIAIVIAGAVFGREAASNQVFETLKDLMGPSGADVAQKAIAGASQEGASILASIVGGVTLLFGASGVFSELNQALNDIWSVTLRKVGMWNTLRERFLSMTMVLGVGFLLLVSLLLTAALGVIGRWLEGWLPGGEAIWQVVNFIVSFALISFLFAAIFKYVPDIKVRWREVLIAGAVTSLLFSLGKLGLGLYLSKGAVGSAYGAAASLIVLLVWVYYSAQILFFGAELSRALTLAARAKVTPARMADGVRPKLTDSQMPPAWPKPT
jgi:membrane protein